MTTGTSNFTPPRAQTKRQAPQPSVHMNVLGMDGTDHDVGVNRRNNNDDNITTTSTSTVSQADEAGNDTNTAQEASLGALPSRPVTPGRGRKPPPSSSPSSTNSNSNITPPSRHASINHNNHTEINGRQQPQPQQEQTGPPASDKSYWWGKVLFGKTAGTEDDDDDDEASTQYQSLEAPENERPRQRMPFGPASSLMLTSSTSTSETTVEDRLKQDCSFFYQGIEDSSSFGTAAPGGKHQNNSLMARAAGLRPLTSVLNHQMMIPRLLSSREGARFREQYERLNQDIVYPDSDDLFLDEYQQGHNGNNRYSTRQQQHARQMSGSSEVIDFASTATTTQTGRLSTLFFEQDGRMLMRLPRDQVRLIMEEDLEPGIISVEQWRKVDKNHYNPAGPPVGDEEGMMMILEDDGVFNSKSNSKGTQQPPPLRYVMTVPDDLYRRVVAEMSYALQPPCWGFFKCCDGEGRADIKLALAILVVILFLMFISTMEWPTE